MAKKHGHYCKVCEEYKSNESFSGKGHSAHICKKCAVLSPAERSREMTLARLMNLPYRLSAEQKAWLKGLQKDKCPEIAEAAQMVYAEHFPYAERNERKQQLHISEMTFVVQDELWDEYGDSFDAQIMFILGPVDKCQKTAETRSGPGRIGNMQIEKDGACHPFKV